MSSRSFLLDDRLADYVVAHTRPEDDVLAGLAAETRDLGPISVMQISADQGAFMELLVKLSGARSAVEVGTFTGYSSICIARGLGPGGRLICCDVSEDWTAIARRYWAEADLTDRIELRIGPALDSLAALPDDLVVDFAFLDAAKTEYGAYVDALWSHLRPGSLILVDNVLWSGRVPEPEDAADDADTAALRAFNDRMAADDRFETVLLALGDGLTFALVK